MALWNKIQSMLGGGEKTDIAMRFELLSEGFVGTMSRFYKARDRKHDRIVGLKLCDSEKTALFESRFAGLKKPSEGEIAIQLKHPRIVETYEYGVSDKGQAFTVMEYLSGPGLQLLVRQRDEQLAGKAVEPDPADGRSRPRGPPGRLHPPGHLSAQFPLHPGTRCPETDRFRADVAGPASVPAAREPDRDPDVHGSRDRPSPGHRPPRRYLCVRGDGLRITGVQLPWPLAESTGKGALSHDTQPPVPLLEAAPWVNRILAAAISDCMAANRDQRPASMDVFLKRIQRLKDEREE
jgi:eukaryotic-like serine/threonine-protein kinase